MANFRQILVDGSPVGFRGLDEIFDGLWTEGRRPGDSDLGEELVRRAARDNYIPYGAREHYAAALDREFAAYVSRRETGDQPRRRGYGMWRGYPREQIPWFPTISHDLCDGCGVCLRLCSTGALQPTDGGKARVDDPFACIVGCSSCARVCKPDAIVFPPRTVLDAYKMH